MSMARWNPRKPTREMEYIRDSIGPVSMPAADSIQTAPGWCLLADDYYTMIEPSDGPWVDPEVLRAIHSFDPGLIAFWRKQLWLLPDKITQKVVSHVCVGRHVRNPHREIQIFRVETPAGFEGEVPNEFEFILENAHGTWAYDEGGPGSPAPFNMGLYHLLRECYNESLSGGDYFDRLNERRKSKLEAARRFRAAENQYKGKHLEAYIDKQLEKASPTEFAEYQARARARRPHGGKNKVSFSGFMARNS